MTPVVGDMAVISERRATMRSTRALAVAGVTLATALGVTTAQATQFVNVDLENASISGQYLTDSGVTYRLQKQGQAEYATLPPSPYEGQRSIKFVLPPNTDSAIDRSELEVVDVPFSAGTRFYGFRIFVPSDMTASTDLGDAGYNIFTQMWQYGPAMPIVTLEVRRGSALKYDLVVRNDDTGPIWDNAAWTWPIRHTGTLDRGVWTNFMLKVTPNPTGNGEVKLYKNDTLIYVYTGKVGYSTAYTPDQRLRWKVGMYAGNTNHPYTRYLYFDNVRYGDTYSDAWPG
jgi:hypothetical protein